MSISSRSANGTQARQRTFRIYFVIEGMTYSVVPLRPDPGVADRAYRLTKEAGDKASYDVHTNGKGLECECLGYLRWRKPCKHIRCLIAAGMLAPTSPVASKPTKPGINGETSNATEA